MRGIKCATNDASTRLHELVEDDCEEEVNEEETAEDLSVASASRA